LDSAFERFASAIAADSGWTVESDRPSGSRSGREAGRNVDLLLIFDGGAIGNPGSGYGSFTYKGRAVRWPTRVTFPGLTTNNQAEYQTLIAGLRGMLHDVRELDLDPSALKIEIRSDSELLVNQVNGAWKLKNAGLRALHDDVRGLLDRFERWKLTWHPRAESVRILGH
jgi:probable phosphoglycerate mutase